MVLKMSKTIKNCKWTDWTGPIIPLKKNTFYVPSNEVDFKQVLSKVLKFLEEEIQSFEKLFEELNGELLLQI